MQKNKIMIVAASFILLAVVVLLGVFLSKTISVKGTGKMTEKTADGSNGEKAVIIKLFFPDGHRLKLEQREMERFFSQKKILKGAVTEFLKGPSGSQRNIVPVDTLLLGVYMGNDGIAYINLSEDFKRNFHGDVPDEFLLLKSLYETVISNVQVDNIKLLIDSKESDSIGGHFSVDRPLKQLVTQEIRLE
jgi:spore germination protein GerM